MGAGVSWSRAEAKLKRAIKLFQVLSVSCIKTGLLLCQLWTAVCLEGLGHLSGHIWAVQTAAITQLRSARSVCCCSGMGQGCSQPPAF